MIAQVGAVMSFHVAFVTIGQSPRSDMLPEILAHTRTVCAVTERGALDGLSDDDIHALAPKSGEPRLATRLRDGRDVVVAKRAIDRRLRAIVTELDTGGFDLLVLLCTGRFSRFVTRIPLLQAQHVVDNFVQGIAGNAARVGIVLPNPEQISEFHGIGDLPTKIVSASPFESDHDATLREAGAALSDADIIVLHCMSFTEAMRHTVSLAAGRAVLAPRRLLAHAIDMVLS